MKHSADLLEKFTSNELEVYKIQSYAKHIQKRNDMSAVEKSNFVKQNANLWEARANNIEKSIKNKKREESLQEQQKINNHLIGAIKAKMSIIDSMEL
mmetsp:Transcript_2294/g.2239  ORF Transcript_2294/g.2239 Transcript_2294/m.2239 type:complete len:97 (-) Transcript_2294:56-346(-)